MLSPHLPYGQVFFVPSVRMKLKNGFALALQPLYRLATYLLNNFIEKISPKIEFHLFFFKKVACYSNLFYFLKLMSAYLESLLISILAVAIRNPPT